MVIIGWAIGTTLLLYSTVLGTVLVCLPLVVFTSDGTVYSLCIRTHPRKYPGIEVGISKGTPDPYSSKDGGNEPGIPLTLVKSRNLVEYPCA